MFKTFVLFVLALSSIYANEKVEVYATSMDTKGNIVKAYGEVIVVYKDYSLSADKAVYNKETGILELFDNVRVNQSGKNGNGQLLGNYAKLNIAQKERTFKPFYMTQEVGNEELWISACQSVAKDVEIEIKSGVLSGCDPVDPLWTMEFSSAKYNTDTMWLDLYNARIYIDDIPVFYTPYFGYSLNTKRRTGVLIPMVGLSKDEGFYYTQSLYIAESAWWDLEIIPQLRTKRGSGVYSTFRWVDSAVSKGSFTYGFFKEKDTYFNALDSNGNRENDLANQKHQGFNFSYEHNDFLNTWFGSSLDGQSGLYADIDDMNDVEYINLSSNNLVDIQTATQIYSRVNVFYNGDKNYYGTYFKYYKNLELESNDLTIQNVPSLHYHRYLDTLLDDHFLYNLNLKTNNFYRQEGKNATQTNLNIPLALQTSLFNEYLNVSYTASLYGQHTSFSGNLKDGELTNEKLYEDGHYLNNSHAISISSQLTRAYENITHVIDIGTLYTASGTESRNGYYDTQKDICSDQEGRLNNPDICEFYNVAEVEDSLETYFSQFIFDIDGKQIIYHRVAQNYTLEDTEREFGELENELYYNITDNIDYYNNMFFNYYENGFSKNFNRVSYHDKSYTLALSHMHQDSFINPSALNNYALRYTSYITSNFIYRHDKHYTYNLRYDHDLELHENKSIEVGVLYKKKCWDFGVRYVENNRPTLDQNGVADSKIDRFIYFTIALKPIIKSQGDSGFVYKLPE